MNAEEREINNGRFAAAPSLQQLLHMPRVSAVGEASRCATHLYGTFRNFLCEAIQFFLMMCITLTFCLRQWPWNHLAMIVGIVSNSLTELFVTKRKPTRCRRIGGRRYPQRRMHERQSRPKCYYFSWILVALALTSFFYQPHVTRPDDCAVMHRRIQGCWYCPALFCGNCPWHITRRRRNKLLHALTGNGGGMKGGSKGGEMNYGSKGYKGPSPEEVEADYQRSIRDALPAAAKARLVPVLFQEEWSAPIRSPHELCHKGGVAICYKQDLPEVLRRINFTLEPTAVLLAQDPPALGLRGYDFEAVQCSFRVRLDDGSYKTTTVERFLCQLGFGSPVRLIATGDIVHLPTCMHRFVAKFPSVYGWQEEMITGTTIAKLLQKQLPNGSFFEILPRTGGKSLSATFRAHSDVVDTILRMSGTDAVFYKLHESENIRPDLDLLWLPEGTSLDNALVYTKEKDVFGVALKNAAMQPRLALRFMSQDALQKFAAEKKIDDVSHLGRWKLHGVPSFAGPVAVYAILEQKKWKVHEILYFSSKHCVFLAESKGDDAPMCFAHGIHSKQLRFEAINSIAKKQQAESSQASRASSSQPVALPQTSANAFWKRLQQK